MTVLLGQTGGAGMPAAAVAPTIDPSVARASDASAASSVKAAALIVVTLITCLDLDTHNLDNRDLVGSLHTVGPDLGGPVGSRQTVGPDSGSCHGMVGWILDLRPEFGGGSLTVASAESYCLRADWLRKLGGAEQHSWRRC
jgi:hypothetical protein